MPVSITLQEIPIGSQFVETIGADDPDALNDFKVLILTSENGTGLEKSDITLSTGASLVELTGDGVTREAVIRPPTTAGMLTITVGADAFSEGNVETSKDIRISTSFPDADAETPTQLFDTGLIGATGLAVSPTRILIAVGSGLRFFTHDGTLQTSENHSYISVITQIDYFNNTILARAASNIRRYDFESDRQIGISPVLESLSRNLNVVHTEKGIVQFRDTSNSYRIYPYGSDTSTDLTVTGGGFYFLGSDVIGAHQSGLIYLGQVTSSGGTFILSQLRENNELEFLGRLNIDASSGSFQNIRDIAIYQDTLYSLDITGGRFVYTLDIKNIVRCR